MSFDPEKPFNDLPLLPPKAEIETKATLKKAISANKALAELKGMGITATPDQAIVRNSMRSFQDKVSMPTTWNRNASMKPSYFDTL